MHNPEPELLLRDIYLTQGAASQTQPARSVAHGPTSAGRV